MAANSVELSAISIFTIVLRNPLGEVRKNPMKRRASCERAVGTHGRVGVRPLAHRPSRPRSNGRGNRAPFLLRTEDYRAARIAATEYSNERILAVL